MRSPARDLIERIDGFIQYLESSNYSPHSIQSYKRNLSVFTSFMESKSALQLNKVTYKNILDYKKSISNKSTRTQFAYIVALRNFLKWCEANNIQSLHFSLVSLPKIKSQPKVTIKGKNIDKALSAIKTNQHTGTRDKAILELLVATGIRVSELVSLDRENIDYENKKIIILGKRRRAINLSRRALEYLSKYLKHRQDQASALFVSYKGKRDRGARMTVRSVQRLVKKYTEITPTILRRSFTMDLLSAGETMTNLQKILGQKHLY